MLRMVIAMGFVICVVVLPASAGMITYNFQLDAPNGYPLTHLVLYAAGAGQDDVFMSPVELPPAGVFQLTHPLGFEPTSALVVGITERDRDDRWDVVMFTGEAYATSAVGLLFSELFPTDRNVRHSELTLLAQDAHAGDAVALDALTSFLRGPDAAAAYFDPRGSYSIIQFTIVEPPIGGPVPEPASLGLIGLAMLAARRKRS